MMKVVLGAWTQVLFRSVAHEIKQPFGATFANADAAEVPLESGGETPAELREAVADITQEDLRASEVVRRVRALARRRELQSAPLDVNGVVTDMLELPAGEMRLRPWSTRSTKTTRSGPRSRASCGPRASRSGRARPRGASSSPDRPGAPAASPRPERMPGPDGLELQNPSPGARTRFQSTSSQGTATSARA